MTNPWPEGTAEAAEHDAITARLDDPLRERRLLRQLAEAEPHHPRLLLEPDVVRQLSAAGVLFGPDCSKFQGNVNWSAVYAAGCRIFAYKVSEGRSYRDDQEGANQAETAALQAAGKGVALAYHYLFGSAEYAANPLLWAAQADWFVTNADPHAIHALDVEAAMGAPGLGVDQWVRRYFTHYPRKALLVYSNHAMWTVRSHVTSRVPAGQVFTWHAGIGDGYYTARTGSLSAEWAGTASLHDSMLQLGFPPARLWQFTDHAVVPGVNGTCDGNAFLGTLAELQALATGTGVIDMPLDSTDKAWLKGNEFLSAVADAVGGRASYRDTDPYDAKLPLTWDRILNELLRRSDDPATLSAAGQQQLLGALGPLIDAHIASNAGALAATIAAKLGGSADASAVKTAVVEALKESLPTFDIVAQPAKPTA